MIAPVLGEAFSIHHMIAIKPSGKVHVMSRHILYVCSKVKSGQESIHGSQGSPERLLFRRRAAKVGRKNG